MRPVLQPLFARPSRSRASLVAALACGALAACATKQQTARPPMSAGDHLAEAERHEADARALEESAAAAERTGAPTQVTCGDTASTELITSGTERLHVLPPCWAGEASAIRRERAHAAQLRTDARRHRIQAREMVLSQQKWCAGLPEAELDHSPFDHREDLRGVQAELEGDRLRGARIFFRQVPGLDAEWMMKTLACHQAIASAEGYDSPHLAACPSAVQGAKTTVRESPFGLEVVITSLDPGAAIVIYGRAEALLDPPREDE